MTFLNIIVYLHRDRLEEVRGLSSSIAGPVPANLSLSSPSTETEDGEDTEVEDEDFYESMRTPTGNCFAPMQVWFLFWVRLIFILFV